MIGLLAAITLALGTAHANPCDAGLPRGPAVAAPMLLSTDCGWFRLETDGAVSRLPVDWYATHKQTVPPHYTIARTRTGRYLVQWKGRTVWRSAGLYFNEAGDFAFGPRSFVFASYGRRGVFLTDLRGPERLVLRGRGKFPLGFTRKGELIVVARRMIFVLSPAGKVVRRFDFRPSSSYAFDPESETIYFVSPGGMLSVAHGSEVRRIRKIRQRGWINVLGRRLLTFTDAHRLAVLRRQDGALVADTSWGGGLLDAGVDVSDDGRLFAFRVTPARGGQASVYVLRAGEHRAQPVYRHHFKQVGCGFAVTFDWHGSSLLYRSDAGGGVSRAALLSSEGKSTPLTPLLGALPRISPATPGNVFWAAGFS
jgi:hypothetical protein